MSAWEKRISVTASRLGFTARCWDLPLAGTYHTCLTGAQGECLEVEGESVHDLDHQVRFACEFVAAETREGRNLA